MKMCSYKSQFVQFILLTALNIFGNLLTSKHSLIIRLFILQLQYINTAAPIAQIHHCSRVWLLTYSSVTIAACRKYVATMVCAHLYKVHTTAGQACGMCEFLSLGLYVTNPLACSPFLW